MEECYFLFSSIWGFSRAFSAQSSCDFLGIKCLGPQQGSFVEALTLNMVDGIWWWSLWEVIFLRAWEWGPPNWSGILLIDLSLFLSFSPLSLPEQAYTQERPCTRALGKKVAICKPGRHSSPEPNYGGTLTLDLQPPELWEKFLLSYPVCGILLWQPQLTNRDQRSNFVCLEPFYWDFFSCPQIHHILVNIPHILEEHVYYTAEVFHKCQLDLVENTA